MNLNTLVGVAKLMLPKNSPWLSRIEQAQQMAGRFDASPAGVQALMAQLGKNQADLKDAVDALNNPAISGMLDKFSPGLTAQLRQAGSSLLGAPAPLSQPLSPATPETPAGDPLAALREKLKRM